MTDRKRPKYVKLFKFLLKIHTQVTTQWMQEVSNTCPNSPNFKLCRLLIPFNQLLNFHWFIRMCSQYRQFHSYRKTNGGSSFLCLTFWTLICFYNGQVRAWFFHNIPSIILHEQTRKIGLLWTTLRYFPFCYLLCWAKQMNEILAINCIMEVEAWVISELFDFHDATFPGKRTLTMDHFILFL